MGMWAVCNEVGRECSTNGEKIKTRRREATRKTKM
jgi:hypothetical protein